MDNADLSKRDTYQTITEKIVAAIEAGVAEYRMPWHRSGTTIARPINALTAKPYNGVNVVALWADATLHRFGSGYWATYRQWRELGAHVRKGQRGSTIVFYKAPAETEATVDADDKATEKPRLIARASWVFNAEQIDGWSPPKPVTRNEVDLREGAEAFIAATQADIRKGGDRAFYDRIGDFIAVPYPEQFMGTETSSATECFYSVILHELTHNAEPSVMPRRPDLPFKTRPDGRCHAA